MSSYNWPTSMPYDVINIHDQTAYSDISATVDTVTIPDDPIAFIPFISPRGYGKDNELVYLGSSSIGRYGNPDYYKYGLSLYLANQFIDGGGNIAGIRLKAENGTYSHVGIYADVAYKNDIYTAEQTIPDTDTKVDSPYWIGGDYTANNPYIKPDYQYDGSVISFTSGTSKSYEVKDGDTVLYTIKYIDVQHTEEQTNEETGETTTVITSVDRTILVPKHDTENWTLITGTITDSTTIAALSDNDDPRTAMPDDKITYTVMTVKKLHVKIGSKSYSTTDTYTSGTKQLPIASNEDILKNSFAAFKSDDATANIGSIEGDIAEDETYTIPLFMLYSLASGKTGINIRIEYDSTMETVVDTIGDVDRFYKMSTFDGNTEIEGKISFSLSDYIYNDQSMFIQDVVEDNCNTIGYLPIALNNDMTTIDKLYDIIEKYAEDDMVNGNPASIDVLFGTKRISNLYNTDNEAYALYKNFVLDSDSIDLSNISFDGGSLGDFEPSVDSVTRTEAMVAAFVNAYSAKITDLIFDQVRYPFTFIFQPIDDSRVSDAIYNLVVECRDNTEAIMFTAPSKSYLQARNIKGGYTSTYDTDKMIFWSESAIVRDPYTHKRIRMPSVYFNAKAIPRTITQYGWGTPLAGSKFYWDGFVTNTLEPRSSDPNEYIKNHNFRLNTMIENGAGIANAYEQITAQSITSQLSEANNAIVLRKMCSIALNIARNRRWTDLGESDINEYKTTVETAILGQLGGSFASINIEAERETVNGAGRNRIHCRITASFNALLKGVTYDIYIV